MLSPDDATFTDSRSGWGWSDRCYKELQAGKLGWAGAACDHGLTLHDLDTRAVAALQYNKGLVAEQAGEKEAAQAAFLSSLAARSTDDPGRGEVAAALARVAGAAPETPAGVGPPLANLAGRWRLVRQGQSARVTPGDCDDRIGKMLTITATHIAYEGDSCDDEPPLRLKTDCEVHKTTIGSWDLGRYQGNLQDLVHEEVANVIDTGCSAPARGPFGELLVLGSGELVTELAGNYYVFRKLK
jgi:hypothetical protein